MKDEKAETKVEEKVEAKEEVKTEEPKQEEDLSNLSEADVAAMMDTEKKIPYKVFQERNAKLRDTERELRALREEKAALEVKQVDTPVATRQAPVKAKEDYMDFGLEDEEAATVATPPALEELNFLKEEIGNLKGFVNQVKEDAKIDNLKREFKELKDTYAHADEAVTMALKMRKPSWTLEECAEYSHNRISGLVDTKLRELIQTKKSQQQSTKDVSPAERIAKEFKDKAPTTFEEMEAIAPELIS